MWNMIRRSLQLRSYKCYRIKKKVFPTEKNIYTIEYVEEDYNRQRPDYVYVKRKYQSTM